jgi:hypothetical protein
VRVQTRIRLGRVGLGLLVVVAGCGLRTQQPTNNALTGQPADTIGARTAGAGAAASGGVGGLTGLTSGSTGGTGSAAGATGNAAAQGTAPSVSLARGATSGSGSGAALPPIVLGFQVTKNLQAAFTATGAGGGAPDERSEVVALSRWINATGGINGHKVQIVIHETDVTSGSFASQSAAACADFTQDHHVLAVASSPVDPSDDLLPCLAQHGTPDIEQGLWPYDDTYYRRYPGMLYQPGRASPNRWGPVYVDVLDREHWFDGAKVGLVRFDSPVYARMADVIKSAMAAHGQQFAKEAVIATPGSLSDLGSMSGPINNAIVQFRAAGINHVMFAASGELPFFFMTEADSQQWRPKWGLSTNDVPDTQVDRGVPTDELQNAVAVGWQPANDIGDANYPLHDPARMKCEAIMKKYGSAPSAFYSDSHCDSLFFLRDVLSRLSSFSVPAMQGVVARLGTSYDSPLTFHTKFGPGRYNGPSEARFATFSNSKGHFQYVGPAYPM